MPAFTIEFKAIVPKQWNLDWVRLELLNTLRAEARVARREYQRTTATWVHQPQFTISDLSLRAGAARITVGTTDRIYGYVDQGTRRHVIEPRFPLSFRSGRPSSLRFLTGYRAKTRPRRLWSTFGGRYGRFVYPVRVSHPGIKPRGFTKLVQRQAQQRLNVSAPKAIARGIEKGIK